ncbi:MAG: DNA internalization-related competence protein ComEC/Rec2 [Eubacterium sp.]|nr:DNA internalization-related competence protein ComEC/Rec2 [Eubacterium sp.]
MKRRWNLLNSKRTVFAVSLILAAGISAAEFRSIAAGFLLLGICIWVALTYSFPVKRVSVLLFTGVFLFGAFYAGYEDINSRWYEDSEIDESYAFCRGRVYDKSSGDDTSRIYIENATVSINETEYLNINLILYFADDKDAFNQIKAGQIISAYGTVSLFDTAANPGNFDMRDYYRRKGIDFSIFADGWEIVNYKFNYVSEFLCKLREGLKTVYSKSVSEDAAGVLLAMTAGDKSLLTDDIKNLYQSAGISHILAISGLHVSVIGMLLFKLLRKLNRSYILSSLISGSAVLLFGSLCSFRLSALRAIIMFIVMISASTMGRPYDSLTSLGIAGIIIMLINPLALFSTSFLLSFSAVLGAVYVNSVLNQYLSFDNYFAKSVILSFSVQLTILPVMMYFYCEIPVYCCLINLLVLPFCGVLLGGAIVGGFLGFFLPFLSFLILKPCEFILFCYRLVCEAFSKLPFNTIVTGRPPKVMIVLYYITLLFFLSFLENKNKKEKKDVSSGNKLNMFLKPAHAVAFISIWTLVMSFKPLGFAEVAMLNVGQGDGIYVKSDGLNIFVDGGSSDVSSVGEQRILPYLKYRGVGEIDYWFVSHTDNDHISGIFEILNYGYRIKNLVFAKGMVYDETSDELIALAKDKNTNVIFLGKGESVNYKNTCIKCIYPNEKIMQTDKNEASMVMEFTNGNFKVLFTGDAGKEAEEEMIKSRVLEDIVLLKCGHHGSKSSSSAEFLKQISPEAVIISAGVDNSYGHPDVEALERIYNVCPNVYCTKELGLIRVVWKNEKMIISN